MERFIHRFRSHYLISAAIIELSACGTQVEAANDLICKQFFEQDLRLESIPICVETKGSILSVRGSEPRSPALQCVLEIEHPKYEEEYVLKKTNVKDGRTRVTSFANWPYSIFGQLQMKYWGQYYQGSGTLISPCHVLTCAHNIFSDKLKRWADKVTFRPGLNERNAPFHQAEVVKGYVYKEWSTGNEEGYDIALLVLDRAIGKQTVWAGLLCMDDRSLLMEKPEITGYPGDKGGTQMWTMFHRFREVSSTTFRYEIDTSPGQVVQGCGSQVTVSPFY